MRSYIRIMSLSLIINILLDFSQTLLLKMIYDAQIFNIILTSIFSDTSFLAFEMF